MGPLNATASSRRLVIAVAVAAGAAWLLASCGGDARGEGGVRVEDVYAPVAPSGASVGAVYFSIESGDDDAVIGVTVSDDVAAQASLHRTVDEGGMTSMEPVERLELPSGDEIVLEPGGLHVMLTGLRQPLASDLPFELTLDLEVDADVTFEVPVVDSRTLPDE